MVFIDFLFLGGPNDEKWHFEWILIDTNLFINDVIQSISVKRATGKQLSTVTHFTRSYTICAYNFPNHQNYIAFFHNLFSMIS